MKFLYVVVALIISIPSVHAQMNEGDELVYQFEQKDSSYSFTGHFIIDSQPDLILRLIYTFENIPSYTPDIVSCNLDQESDYGYDVTYQYKKLLIFKNESKWRRTLLLDEDKIKFELISSNSNIDIFPEVLSLSGYYQVSPLDGRCQVKYYQEAEFIANKLKKVYIYEVKKSLIKFLTELRIYLEDQSNKPLLKAHDQSVIK